MAEPARPRFADDCLSHLLAHASEVLSRQFHRTVREAGLSVAEWRVLAALADAGAGGVAVKDLAEIALMQQPTVTKLVARMESAGLVRRDGNPSDRRQTLVQLAPLGQARVRALLPKSRAHEARALRAHTAADIAQLKDQLRSLIAVDQPSREATSRAAGSADRVAAARSRSSSARLRATPQR